jgi:hypothetical protein
LVDSGVGRQLGLERVTRLGAWYLRGRERKKLAPKEGGLNIEGLCASPEGETLYIGLRNPPFAEPGDAKDKAILVPLDNGREVIEEEASPVFGEPILLELGGLGIRSMEYSPYYRAYLIAAGPADERAEFALYRWSGERDERPVKEYTFAQKARAFTPEALIVFGDSPKLLVLSDDGSIVVDVADASECMAGELLDGRRCLNKHLADSRKKTFTGMWLTLE